MILHSNSIDETIALGRTLSTVLLDDDVVVLCGDLGAGKTHLSKGIALGFGIDSEVTSPTFNILRQYDFGDGRLLCHWDLYRLDEEEQLDDVDFFGILESGCVTLIEWGDRFPEALPDDYLKVSISLDDSDSRIIEVEGCGPRGVELEGQFAALLEK